MISINEFSELHRLAREKAHKTPGKFIRIFSGEYAYCHEEPLPRSKGSRHKYSRVTIYYISRQYNGLWHWCKEYCRPDDCFPTLKATKEALLHYLNN